MRTDGWAHVLEAEVHGHARPAAAMPPSSRSVRSVPALEGDEVMRAIRTFRI